MLFKEQWRYYKVNNVIVLFIEIPPHNFKHSSILRYRICQGTLYLNKQEYSERIK